MRKGCLNSIIKFLGLSLIVLEMGKHLWSESEDELVEVNCPSCMRGIIHALDWHNSVKKVLPHKKHNGPKHTKVLDECIQ
ncbi:unnamed protein product [Camellia sinensis]